MQKTPSPISYFSLILLAYIPATIMSSISQVVLSINVLL